MKYLICFFLGHKWDQYSGHEGYRDHRPTDGAACERCHTIYHDKRVPVL